MKSEKFEKIIEEIVWIIVLLANQVFMIHSIKNPNSKKRTFNRRKVNSDFSEVKTRFLMRTPTVAMKLSARVGTSYEQSECGGLNKDMFIKFDGNVYDIVYINDYGYDKKYTEIIAELVNK